MSACDANFSIGDGARPVSIAEQMLRERGLT
jgi:hypothetical protein